MCKQRTYTNRLIFTVAIIPSLMVVSIALTLVHILSTTRRIQFLFIVHPFSFEVKMATTLVTSLETFVAACN